MIKRVYLRELDWAMQQDAPRADQRILCRAREEPSWTNALGFTALGFLSATMGIQGIVGKVRCD